MFNCQFFYFIDSSVLLLSRFVSVVKTFIKNQQHFLYLRFESTRRHPVNIVAHEIEP